MTNVSSNGQNWFFNWVGGGYNSVRASTKAEALALATTLGSAREYAPGKMTVTLVPDVNTLVRDPNCTRANAENARYSGMYVSYCYSGMMFD